jgi:hypothetical protein
MCVCEGAPAQLHPHMKVHCNARMVPRRRAAMVEAVLQERLTWRRAAAGFHVASAP